MAKKRMSAKKSASGVFDVTWHFFVPAAAALVITFIFSDSFVLALQVAVVVVVFSFIARWLAEKK